MGRSFSHLPEMSFRVKNNFYISIFHINTKIKRDVEKIILFRIRIVFNNFLFFFLRYFLITLFFIDLYSFSISLIHKLNL